MQTYFMQQQLSYFFKETNRSAYSLCNPVLLRLRRLLRLLRLYFGRPKRR